MFISRSKDTVLFCTKFSKKYNLVQKFRGVSDYAAGFNNPVDITETGLIYVNKWDCWHIDIPFSISNDEAPPCLIKEKWIGANHGFSGAVSLYAPYHDKTVSDIGSLWQDAEGTKWILLSVKEDILTFISENIGESINDYSFKDYIAVSLTYVENGVNQTDILVEGDIWKSLLQPVIRHKVRKIIPYKDGEAYIVNRDISCDYAEIVEEYEIVNPASMAEMIYKSRPKQGYESEILKAMGEPMINVRMVYRIENDGTILCDFIYNRVADVHFSCCMGAMFQERLNSFGGGVYRYIPKILPVETNEGIFDFSEPLDTASDSFPKDKHVTSEYWENPLSPPDRIIDYFKDVEGKKRVGFVCGHLPVYDGVPEIRACNAKSAIHLVKTRKVLLRCQFLWRFIRCRIQKSMQKLKG